MEILFFTRHYCYECQHTKKQLEELKSKYKITVKEIDADFDPLAQEYNINKVPCTLITKSGFELYRFNGLAPIQAIERKVSDNAPANCYN